MTSIPPPDHDHAIGRWTFWVAVFTLGVGVFTLLLAIVSGIADWFIYRQYSIATQSFELANQSFKDTREQQRAVVSQTSIEIFLFPDQTGKLVRINFVAVFQNYGTTRTAEFHGWISAHYFDAVPDNLDFSKPFNKIDVPNRIVPPGIPVNIGPVTIAGDDADKLTAGSGVGLIWGRVEYSDIFERNKLHPISFCMLATVQSERKHIEIAPYRSDCNQS